LLQPSFKIRNSLSHSLGPGRRQLLSKSKEREMRATSFHITKRKEKKTKKEEEPTKRSGLAIA
jgi:hypothetical protein